MPATGLIDEQAIRVGTLAREAVRAVLGDRLVCLAVHGSAVTGYVAGVSDFDFVIFMHGRLDADDAVRLHALLASAEIEPFTYLQISRVHDVDREAAARHTGLIDGVYALLWGAIPPGWIFHTEDELRADGRASLQRMIEGSAYRYEHWAVDAAGHASERRLRLFMTEVKPNLRALLVELGEPLSEVWRSPYPELTRRLRRYDASLADELEALLAPLPATTSQQDAVGEQVLSVLARMSERAAAVLAAD